MSKLTIPDPITKKINQPNLGENFGQLWASWGLDLLSSPGRFKIADYMIKKTDSADDADLGWPTAFVRSEADGTDRWWALCHTVLFKTAGTDPTAAFTQDAIASTPTGLNHFYSDLVDFNGALIVSRSGDLDKLSGGVWTASWWQGTLGQTALTSSIYIPLHVGFEGRLLIGDGRYVHAVTKDNNVKYKAVILKPEFRVVKIVSTTTSYFIFARNLKSGTAKAFEWDGYSENFNREYDLEATRPFSAVVKDNIPYCVVNTGHLKKFNGGGFDVVGQFPIANYPSLNWKDDFSDPRPMHPNGMTVKDEEILMLISGATNGVITQLLPNMPSGVWAWNERNGLYHKHALSQNKQGGSVYDSGSEVVHVPGALVSVDDQRQLLAGAGIYDDNVTTEKKGIHYLSSGPRARFITPKIYSSQVQSSWASIWTRFKQLASSSDKIIVKYRTSDDFDLKDGYYQRRFAITWTAGNTFTTTDTNFANVAVGNEVEIFVGKGSGRTVHITDISESAGTYTVTIDETLTSVSGTAQVRVANWTKLEAINDTNILEKETGIFDQGGWIQFKLELRQSARDALELEEMTVVSTPHKTYE